MGTSNWSCSNTLTFTYVNPLQNYACISKQISRCNMIGWWGTLINCTVNNGGGTHYIWIAQNDWSRFNITHTLRHVSLMWFYLDTCVTHVCEWSIYSKTCNEERKPKRHMLRWDWTMCPQYIIIIGSIFNTNGRAHVITSKNRRKIFTLISYEFYISTLILKLEIIICVSPTYFVIANHMRQLHIYKARRP